MSEIVMIGSLREPVELLEAPRGGSNPRVGRIRHANGENAAIDLDTLEALMARAARSELLATSEYTLDQRLRDRVCLIA